jgi:hypothetical protein
LTLPSRFLRIFRGSAGQDERRNCPPFRVVGVELRADQGRAVLVGAPDELELPFALANALHDWAEVARAVSQEADTDQEIVELVSVRGRHLASRLAATIGTDISYADPVRGVVEHVPAPAPRYEPTPIHEPTPWATGITVSAFTAAVVLPAVITLTSGLSDLHPLVALFGNLVVGAGLAPSVWLSRRTPVWRWVGYGVIVGWLLAWSVLLLGTLGPPSPL